MTTIITPTTVNVSQEATNVVVVKDGRVVFDMPWDAALALAQAIRIKALTAEEHAKAEAIIADQAILTRVGVPMGLTRNPTMLREAAKEAAWNSSLRRYIPLKRAGGIRSQAVFGTPTVIREEGNP